MTGSTTDQPGVSLLGGYADERFLPHATWQALRRILASRGGGTYALSGPRGAGKSWAMERAGTWADRRDGLLVSFPSPSEYEPVAFLASISEVVAKRYEAYYDEKTEATTRGADQRYRRRFVLSLTLLYGFAAMGVYSVMTSSGSRLTKSVNSVLTPTFLIALGGVAAGTALLLYARSEYRKDRTGLRLVLRRAEELRQQVRYAATLKESSELGVEGKTTPLVARLKRASERQLVERPATLSSLIQGFRGFVELMVREIPGPVIIAVDELDKMSDPETVARLLRDIKGIFDVRNTIFLVSLSSEAARNLDLGGVRTRNEFNSSFYTVFDFRPLTPSECLDLLRRRRTDFPERLGRLAGILGAGVPREVVRIAELISAAERDDEDVGHALGVAFGVEVRAFLEDVLASGRPSPLSEALAATEKLAVHQSLGRLEADSPSPAHMLEAVAEWSLNDESGAWREGFQEEWRRLLVRIAVGGVVLSRPEALDSPELAERLQEIVATAALSADVGLVELGAYASSVVFGRATNGTGSGPGEAYLSAYLLGRGGAAFRRGDFLRFAACSERNDADSALAAFCDDGILLCRHGGGQRWRPSDRTYTSANGSR